MEREIPSSRAPIIERRGVSEQPASPAFQDRPQVTHFHWEDQHGFGVWKQLETNYLGKGYHNQQGGRNHHGPGGLLDTGAQEPSPLITSPPL